MMSDGRCHDASQESHDVHTRDHIFRSRIEQRTSVIRILAPFSNFNNFHAHDVRGVKRDRLWSGMSTIEFSDSVRMTWCLSPSLNSNLKATVHICFRKGEVRYRIPVIGQAHHVRSRYADAVQTAGETNLNARRIFTFRQKAFSQIVHKDLPPERGKQTQ
jgi:hypothetical protein